MLHRVPTSPLTPSVATIDTGRASAQARTRFRALVQSPLRAGILRHLHARPHESLDIESIMAAFGRLRSDVEHCVGDLVESGLAAADGSPIPRFTAAVPCDPDLARALEEFLTDRQRESIEDRSPSVQRFREMLGHDEKMMMLFESIRTVARTDLPVLIVGPTGSGKAIVARIVHDLSSREHEVFQSVNCAALHDSLFDSEVFGYERGAFVGAYERKAGRLELANQGTLFLDEVGDLSPIAQAKLLRVIEDRRAERLGSRSAIDLDVRFVCATSRPIEALIGEAAFREDLYYRINAFTIRLPSLRERLLDIPVLAERCLARFCVAHGLPVDARRLAPDATELLLAYPWPGNISELETTVSRAALCARDGYVHGADLQFLHPPHVAGQDDRGVLLSMKDVERDHIRKVLGALNWNKKRAAQILQISRETLYRKIAEYKLAQDGGRT
ncbi:MAG: sigma-54 dependent transcriptional regulator [Acidobacteria bacterium]|nr:sigma-54 dependent transcriptional regulator [Acidobacteriota bacterium]